MLSLNNYNLVELRQQCLAESIRAGYADENDGGVIVERAKKFEAYLLRDVEVHNDGK